MTDKKIYKEIPKFMHDLKKYGMNHFAKEGYPFQPNFSQMQIIVYLQKHSDKEVNQKELENALNLKRSTISGLLDTLEKKHAIQRVSSSQDARKKIIQLNHEIVPSEEEVKEQLKKLNDLLIKDIPKEKIDTFYEVLELMKNNLQEEL